MLGEFAVSRRYAYGENDNVENWEQMDIQRENGYSSYCKIQKNNLYASSEMNSGSFGE